MMQRTLLSTLTAALGGLVFSQPAFAQPPQERALLERLIQCKASLDDVLLINRLVDDKAFNLPEAPEPSTWGWGSPAWTVSPALSVGPASSTMAVMETRRSFFLQVPSTDPGADLERIAGQLHLTQTKLGNTSLDYRKPIGDRTLQVQSERTAKTFWIGCFYDQDALRRLEQDQLERSPEHLKDKQHLQKLLDDQ